MSTQPRPACAFCGRACSDALALKGFAAFGCATCVGRLGRLLGENPEALGAVWPVLWRDDDDDEDGEPEPRVTLPDGQLRERTAELKRELPVQARLQLAGTYGELGMHREQVLECGFILAAAADERLSAHALALLFGHRFTAPDALDRLRAVLFPA
jgi:hypothetical protein